MTTGRPPGAPWAGALRLASFALLALVATGCQKEGTVSCPTGIYCPAGTKCAARQAACIFDDCGDAKLQGLEVCDDGNLFDADGCSSTCLSNETCGNGITDKAVKEECDDGNLRPGDGCGPTCRIETCGNGIVDRPKEQCDDNGETAGCDLDCTYMVHGDGTANTAAREQCDGGHPPPAVPDPDCISSVCNRDCTWTAHGDGKVNPLDGEECDGGSGLPGDDCASPDCNADCTWSRHGDRKVNPLDGEECDGDPGQVTTAMNCQSARCNADCSWSVQGDGIRNPLAGEQCDGGSLASGEGCLGPTCNVDCTNSVCGDGKYNRMTEQCDDGNDRNDDACLTSCRRATCGDGWVWLAATTTPETCDEGTRNDNQDCPYGLTSCAYCYNGCRTSEPGIAHYCGNGDVDADSPEVCDAQTSFVCGTCINDCTRHESAANATGSIRVDAVPANGDLFTVDDATTTVTFEFFDASGACTTIETGIHRCIDVRGVTAADTVAGRIVTAIERTPPALTITAQQSGITVDLENTAAGITGNIPITANNTRLTVGGMTGGVGCPVGSPCTARQGDCRRGASCRSGVCAP